MSRCERFTDRFSLDSGRQRRKYLDLSLRQRTELKRHFILLSLRHWATVRQPSLDSGVFGNSKKDSSKKVIMSVVLESNSLV